MTTTPARLLYIDDDAGLCRLVQRALGRHGYDVTLAANGAEGVALAQGGVFDLIAVDHHMPGMDGMETLAALRALPHCPPVVYVTGADDGRLAVAALKAGAADYVVKTVGQDFTDLLQTTFAQALEMVRLERARDNAEQELRASNDRLAALLREVNHRVANNLQMAIAFIGMQALALPEGEARNALLATQQRIGAIAQVNRRLYATGDVQNVALKDYFDGLAHDLTETWSTPQGPRTVRALTDDVSIQTDRAVTLGMIVCELAGNACKYAYAADAPGEVRIVLRQLDDDRLLLAIEDDGVGLEPDAVTGQIATKGTGLGQKLVKALARGLGTEPVTDQVHKGLRITLDFAAKA